MNEVDLLKIITDYQRVKDQTYPAQESLLIHLYIRVSERIQAVIERELSEYGINTSAFMVLAILYISDDYCQPPSVLHKELYFSRTNITHITDKLQKKNIVKRINNKNDRRGKYVCLTQNGILLAQKLINIQSVILRKIWEGVSDDEIRMFESINKKLLTNVNDKWAF
ncbi:TPA: MarR family transcriptional regulator [Escherichia coli]|nr:MarR family transcriptional regulator [Escherichia coli]